MKTLNKFVFVFRYQIKTKQNKNKKTKTKQKTKKQTKKIKRTVFFYYRVSANKKNAKFGTLECQTWYFSASVSA